MAGKPKEERQQVFILVIHMEERLKGMSTKDALEEMNEREALQEFHLHRAKKSAHLPIHGHDLEVKRF